MDSRSLHTLYPQSLIVNFSPIWRNEKELHAYSKQMKSGQTDGWTFHGQTDHNRASTEHLEMLLTLCSRKSTLAHRNFGEILEFLCFKNKLQQNICYHFTGLMINTTILFSATL